MYVIGYLRVSTADQEYGIDAQRTAIAAEAARRGWEVEYVTDQGRSGKDIDRPGIQRALRILKDGGADALVVSKLDRLSRSLADFARLLETAATQGWGVVAIDLGVDTTTPTGEMIVSIAASVARWERRMIGLRTKEGLAEARAKGVRLGRPPGPVTDVQRRIVRERRDDKRTLAEIADGLNADSVPCSSGGKAWYPSTVRAVLSRVASD